MIIGYYPGAGGNRYYQYLKKLEFSTLGQAYDGITSNFFIKSRGQYPDKLLKCCVDGDILCHAVNYQRIIESFGEHTVYIINADLKASLRREWSIKGKYKPMFQNNSGNYEKFILELYHAIKDISWPGISSLDEFYVLPNRIKNEVNMQVTKNLCYIQNDNTYNFLSSAFEAISWHIDYYNTFPLELGQGILVDINTDDTEFSRIMRNELSLYDDNILFNFVWDVYQTHGSDASIIDLYKNFVNEQQ